MKKYINLSSVLIASCVLMFTQCKKTEIELVGSASKANFSYAQSAGSFTLPYPYKVTFTDSSSEAFLYQWNFGDNSAFSAEKNPVHYYKAGGTYYVTLTTVGTYGNNSITKVISVSDACQYDVFSKLTSCSTAEWTWSDDDDAIKNIAGDGVTVLSSSAATECQLDDVFKFSANGTFAYESNGQTYNQSSGNCGNPFANTSTFSMMVTPGIAPRIILGDLASGVSGNPFLGTTDQVDGNSYEVRSFTVNTITLRAALTNQPGNYVEIKLKKVEPLTLDGIKNILTGGSSRSWVLNSTAGANSVIVGTEGNPGEYYGGGPLADCQVDDVYTFSVSNSLNYNSGGSTFNGGNISPNYNCGNDRSFTTSYEYGAVVGGVEGLAQIKLPNVPPANFIGTTDVPTENLYRIIEITPTRMVLRAGTGAGVVFQFKFVRQ